MSRMKPLHACHRIADAEVKVVSGADLAHSVKNELRDSDGRWTDSPGGSNAGLASMSAKAAAAKRMTADLKPVRQHASHDPSPNKKFPGEPAYADVEEAYDWKHRDKVGSDGTNADGIHQQGLAQIHAKTWADGTQPESDDEGYAQSIWQFYQSPTEYAAINSMLRTGKKDPSSAISVPELRKDIGVMFDKAGFTTTKPMKTYRALKSINGHDWAKELAPGTTFEDDGIVSTTAHNQISQGWLAIDPDGASSGKDRKVQANDVMMEVHLPAGTRIVGGVPEFIETMLKPGTKFKIVSSEKRTATAPDMPLGGDRRLKPFDYTHIIAEVQP